MRFCLYAFLLDKLKHISHEEFECINWLPVTRFKQCVYSVVFKYFNEQCSNYLNEGFDVARENNNSLRVSFQKLRCPFLSPAIDKILTVIFIWFYHLYVI